MVVHLIDGTYELFRQFYGRRRGGTVDDKPFGAVIGVLHSVLEMIETGATHIGVATDHVIESFRNDLWPGYKTGAGRRSARCARSSSRSRRRSPPWAWPSGPWSSSRPTTHSPPPRASPPTDDAVEQVRIWTPDKDLAQCVRGDRVVQVDRRANDVRNESGVREKFGVEPRQIPDFLALVGDAADGYPGIPGIGKVGAARLLNRHGVDRGVPAGDPRGQPRPGAAVQGSGDAAGPTRSSSATWTSSAGAGPEPAFAATVEQLADRRLVARCLAAQPAG